MDHRADWIARSVRIDSVEGIVLALRLFSLSRSRLEEVVGVYRSGPRKGRLRGEIRFKLCTKKGQIFDAAKRKIRSVWPGYIFEARICDITTGDTLFRPNPQVIPRIVS